MNKSGIRLPKKWQRVGFILSYALIPFLISRLVKKLRPKNDEEIDNQPESFKKWILQGLSSYHKVLDTLLNIHIALFYFQGEFYSLSKRIFGMRYAFGHNKEEKHLRRAGNYSFLGGIIFLQYLVKLLIKLKNNDDEKSQEKPLYQEGVVSDIKQLKSTKPSSFELENPKVLPYIPEDSRTCMLCLSPMTDPAAANCGHLFCWECIVDWIREHPECPLCRQSCSEQNLLPLR